MNLKEQIIEDLKAAMKAKETTVLGVLRVAKGEIERFEQTAKGKVVLAEEDIMKIIKKMIDSIKESTNDLTEIKTLEKYLPKQMTEQEIKDVISSIKTELGATSIKQMGQVMNAFKSKYPGMADGKMVSEITKAALS